MEKKSRENLWLGQVVENDEFKKFFHAELKNSAFWAKSPVSHFVLFSALTLIRLELEKKADFYISLLDDLNSRSDVTTEEAEYSMQALVNFCSIDQLRVKLKRELGSEHPFELKRHESRENHFEAWYPLGTLVHVTPNNSPLLNVLGVIEGLLSGCVNVLKLARKDSQFAVIFFSELCKLDESGTLKNYLIIAKISSKNKDDLRCLLSVADVISVWGGEESVHSIREMAPKGARLVEWGHKISFSFISASKKDDSDVYLNLAREICLNEQMSCSSPQCVFIENAEFSDLKQVAVQLGKALNLLSPIIKRILPGVQEQAELTVTKELVRLNGISGESLLVESVHGDWRIYIENTPALNSSPLYRTIWLKPMPREKMISQLRPLKMYLQTAGVAAKNCEIEALTRDLFLSGVQRVRAIGEMTEGYIGEPHDGVYALERFCQRINFQDSKTNPMMKDKSSFEEPPEIILKRQAPIMEKAEFQNQIIEDQYSDLFFQSGGSTGVPKLSVFTYADYHRQMEQAAEGLFAAQLDPKTDRCMNLFYAGSLYGGFTSFFTILEKLNAVQFPMGASTDFQMVGTTIVKNKVNTLLGMPSYLLQLFKENHELFKNYKGIKKIFYGGEHFSAAQSQYLKREFGVTIIRSASYGSVDAGPLGYQCEFSTGGIHHLNEKLHEIEVIDLEKDKPVNQGEIGRLLFSSKVRHGQNIERYAIGDVGRLMSGPCECGRKGIRFELLGRHGDVFRIGTVFLSYQKFQKILIDEIEFEGSIQIHLYPGTETGNEKEKIVVMVESQFNENYKDAAHRCTPEGLNQLLIEAYDDLKMAVKEDLVLTIEVVIVQREKLEYAHKTGKLRSVIDHRSS